MWKIMATKEEMRKFAIKIEGLVANTDYTYLEAIVQHCKDTGLEIEVAATLVNPTLKAKMQEQAEKANLLKVKTSRLPV
jgi:putative aminopeptidase FrvX